MSSSPPSAPPSDGLVKLLEQRNIIDSHRKLTFLGHIALTSGLLIFTIIVYILLWCLGNFFERDWLGKEIEIPPLVKQIELFDKQTVKPEDRQKLSILVEQVNEINDLKARHCRIMSFFYKQYFYLLSIGGTAALVSFICIFFISKEGWKETNSALINIGLTSFGVTLFTLNITQVFQQPQNLKASHDLYVGYAGLQKNLRSAIATEQLIKPNKTIVRLNKENGGYTQLIQDTDAQMEKLSFVRLGFDPTPILDLRNRLESTIGTGNSSKPTVSPPSSSTEKVNP